MSPAPYPGSIMTAAVPKLAIRESDAQDMSVAIHSVRPLTTQQEGNEPPLASSPSEAPPARGPRQKISKAATLPLHSLNRPITGDNSDGILLIYSRQVAERPEGLSHESNG